MATVHALYVDTGFKSSKQICNAPSHFWKPCAGTMKLIIYYILYINYYLPHLSKQVSR